MDVNIYNLVSLATSLFCILTMLLISIKMFEENLRPDNGFSRLRRYLLAVPVVVMVGVGLRLERLFETLHAPIADGAALRASMGVNLVIATITILFILIALFKEPDQ